MHGRMDRKEEMDYLNFRISGALGHGFTGKHDLIERLTCIYMYMHIGDITTLLLCTDVLDLSVLHAYVNSNVPGFGNPSNGGMTAQLSPEREFLNQVD